MDTGHEKRYLRVVTKDMGNKVKSHNKLRSTLTQILMALAALFFFQDVIIDLRSHFAANQQYTFEQLVHLLFEIAAVVALSIGIVDSIRYTHALSSQNYNQSQSLYHLRQDFDAYVKDKFTEWKLTPAEQDVALLLLRGLPSDQIASLRNVALGTIKVQSHNVMQKAGVVSRVELMSVFMDEFIDIGIVAGDTLDPKLES